MRETNTPTPAQERLLKILFEECDYGVAPPVKVLAARMGHSSDRHGGVTRLLSGLKQKGLIANKYGRWRPSKDGLSYLGGAS